MEIVPIPTIGQKCCNCKKNIFAVTTPLVGDIATCPCCGSMFTKNIWVCNDFVEIYNQEKEYEEEKYEDCDIFEFCDFCKIIFGIGCVHANNGCTDSVFYGMLVTSFTLGYYDNVIYGMPVIKNDSDLENLRNVKMECMHCFDPENMKYCEKSIY